MTETNELGMIVETADGSLTLRHPEKDEEYHSNQGALFESLELYMKASGFLQALRERNKRLRVLDVGLGLGYNALTTIESWWQEKEAPALDLLSLEINPALVEALSQGKPVWSRNWSEFWQTTASQLKTTDHKEWQLELRHPSSKESVLNWRILVGAAENGIASLGQDVKDAFDFIWQDPFSPKKNAELWSQEWFKGLGHRAHAETVLVTYSVARAVRDALEGAGWQWEKLPAPGKKKHWLKAKRR